jgi:hypothetical protein
MKFTRKALALSIMAAAASMSAQAVQIDSDNRGQLLLAPVYAAGPGQSTEIRVVNTDASRAVKAHVSFRSATSSIDLLNFLLYLSPGDEWVGTVKDVSGKPTLVSNDDSMLVSLANLDTATGKPADGVFANTSAASFPLFSDRLVNGEKGTMGHVEILGVYIVDDVNTAGQGGNDGKSGLIKQGMSKQVLFDIDNVNYNNQSIAVGTSSNKGGLYDGYLPVFNPGKDLVLTAAVPNDPGLLCATTLPVAPGSYVGLASGWLSTSNANIDANTSTGATVATVTGVDSWCISSVDANIQLYGDVTVKLSENAAPFSYQLIALDDSAVGGVIDNPYYDVIAENDVPLGVRMGFQNPNPATLIDDKAIDNIDNIDNALATSKWVGSYDSLEVRAQNGDGSAPAGVAESLVVVTFPTKYRHMDIFDTQTTGTSNDATSFTSGIVSGATTVRTEADDNVATDRSLTDYQNTYAHYDYDYGYRSEFIKAINGFNSGVDVPYPNHNRKVLTATPATTTVFSTANPTTRYEAKFDFGAYDPNNACSTNNSTVATASTFIDPFANSDVRRRVQYSFESYDTEENSYTETISTTVISGAAGTGSTNNAYLPDEVNLITDAGNSRWYSTMGWYQLAFANTCATPAAGSVTGLLVNTNLGGVPSIVLTVTTDKMGNSRVVHASRLD